MLPKIERIDAVYREKLLSEIDRIVRENGDIEKALDIGDREVLVGMLGLDQEVCDQCRAIWKKMQRRRLGRS